jgi:predicted secreted protein
MLPVPVRLRLRATDSDSHLTSERTSVPLAPTRPLLSRSVMLCGSLFRALVFAVPLLFFVICFLISIAIDDMCAAEKKRDAALRFYADD